jgi:hypothetical protein
MSVLIKGGAGLIRSNFELSRLIQSNEIVANRH